MMQIIKDPNETLDWWLCYADSTQDNRLGDDTISSIDSIAVDPSGEIVVTNSGINTLAVVDDAGTTHPPGTVIAVWLSGGIAGSAYEATVTLTTVGGRTYDDALLIRCLND